jgi:hypothetical protein
MQLLARATAGAPLLANGRDDTGWIGYDFLTGPFPKGAPVPLTSFPLATGEAIVEVEDSEGLVRLAHKDGLVQAKESLESVLAHLKPLAQAILKPLRELDIDEAKLEMGLKLSGEHGLIITKVAGEAHVALTLTWTKPPAKP